MTNLPIAPGTGGHASGHRKDVKPGRETRSNADIRPWISADEAAQVALSGIIKKMEKPS